MGKASIKVFFSMLWATIRDVGIPKTRKDWGDFLHIYWKDMKESIKIPDELRSEKHEKTKHYKLKRNVVLSVMAAYGLGFLYVLYWCSQNGINVIFTNIFVLMYAGAWIGALSVFLKIFKFMKGRKKHQKH